MAAAFGLSDTPNGSTTFGYRDFRLEVSQEAAGSETRISLVTFTPGLHAGEVVELTNALHGYSADDFSINEISTEYLKDGSPIFHLALGDPKVKLSVWLDTAAQDSVLPITSTKITDGAVTTPKIAANAVTAAKITAGTITATEIANGTVTATRLRAPPLPGATSPLARSPLINQVLVPLSGCGDESRRNG